MACSSAANLQRRGSPSLCRPPWRARFLFSFPGLLPSPQADASGTGRSRDQEPIAVSRVPQGRMKLFGTHVYPKNKYLTLHMTRSAKGIVCEDVFESLIVFSQAWWVGTKEENPQELKLDFPKQLQNDVAAADCDFRDGAGATIDEATGNIPGKEIAEPLSPKFESDGDASEDSDQKDENSTQTTSEAPSVRQSARTAGGTRKYTELSSGGDSSDSDKKIEVPEDVDEKRSTRSLKGSPATKGPAAKKQRGNSKGKAASGEERWKKISSQVPLSLVSCESLQYDSENHAENLLGSALGVD